MKRIGNNYKTILKASEDYPKLNELRKEIIENMIQWHKVKTAIMELKEKVESLINNLKELWKQN